MDETGMTDAELKAYVTAAARLQALDLDPAQLERVTAVFARNAAFARLVLDFEPPASSEPAPVFEP